MINYAPKDHLRAIKAHRIKMAEAKKLRRQRTSRTLVATLCVVIIGSLIFSVFIKPVAEPTASIKTPVITPSSSAMTWPANARSAVAGVRGPVLATNQGDLVSPTASVTKVMTALMILKKRPLQLNQQGPDITFTQADVDNYYRYYNGGGSTVPVAVGSTLTQYQALQAILVPSANNIADAAAVWAYGSMSEYHAAANEYAKSLGMTQSVFGGDASGYSSETISTPSDLVLLGQAALTEPVIKSIIGQKTIDLPLVGTLNNTNLLLGSNGVEGIKTGNTFAAGGCLLASATRQVEGRSVTLVTAIMGAPDVTSALAQTSQLLDNAFSAIELIPVIDTQQSIGTLSSNWGAQTEIVSDQKVSVLNWRGNTPTITVTQSDQQLVWDIQVRSNLESVNGTARLKTEIGDPPLGWRLQNLFSF